MDGLFALALRARSEQATAFRRWLTREALPAMARGENPVAPAAPEIAPDDSLGVLLLAAQKTHQAQRELEARQAAATRERRAQAERLQAQERQLEEQGQKLEDLAGRVPERPNVQDGEKTFTQMAKFLRWASSSGRPHASAVGALVRAEAFRARRLVERRFVEDTAGAVRELPVLNRRGVQTLIDLDKRFADEAFEIVFDHKTYRVTRLGPGARWGA